MNLYYGFSREDTSNLPALKLFARDYRFFGIKDCSHHLFYGFYCFVCVTKKALRAFISKEAQGFVLCNGIKTRLIVQILVNDKFVDLQS